MASLSRFQQQQCNILFVYFQVCRRIFKHRFFLIIIICFPDSPLQCYAFLFRTHVHSSFYRCFDIWAVMFVIMLCASASAPPNKHAPPFRLQHLAFAFLSFCRRRWFLYGFDTVIFGIYILHILYVIYEMATCECILFPHFHLHLCVFPGAKEHFRLFWRGCLSLLPNEYK